MLCKLTNKKFTNKAERFAYIQANKETIVKSLKSTPKTKENKFLGFYSQTDQTVKAIPNYDDKFIYPVISNTNYIDMHDDVHMNNSMNKTAKEQDRKVYYVTDHKISVNNIIAMPEDVEVMIMKLNWKDLNKDFEGKTGMQNSIRMMYIKADIGFNSDDDQFAVEKKYYDEALEKSVNKEAFKNVDVVTLVRELKIHLEGSAVPFGSNDATLIKTTEAVNDDTSTIEPLEGTQASIHEMLSKVSLI
jgi:hypothetical protein